MTGTDRLFRQQAVDAQNVMHGRVRIAPPPRWLATNLLIIGTVAAALVFATTVDYARTVSVEGYVDTETGAPALTARHAGILSTRVKLGDRVEAGDLVAETIRQDEDELGSTAQRRRRAIEDERALALMRADDASSAGRSQSDALRQRAQAARSRISTLRVQLEQARIRTAAARDDLRRAQSIADRGFLSSRDLETKASEVAARMQEEASIEERIASAQGDAASAESEAQQALSSAAVERAEALASASRADMVGADGSASERSLHLAPASGTIAALPVRNGRNISPGDSIAVIVPDGARIVATLDIPPGSMGEVRAGQHVDLAIDSYPYQRFGTVPGRIETVSRIATESDEGPAYRIQVSIPDTISAYGRSEPLLPGMSLSARITTQKRSIMEWLLDPLFAVSRR